MLMQYRAHMYTCTCIAIETVGLVLIPRTLYVFVAVCQPTLCLVIKFHDDLVTLSVLALDAAPRFVTPEVINCVG